MLSDPSRAALSTPTRLVARILVAGVHAPTMRAVNYARALGIADTRAIFFAFDNEEAAQLRRDWAAAGDPIPLDVDDAYHRDLGPPILRHVRSLTADGSTAVNVLLPELVLRGPARVLHNHRALFFKRLLLFEEQVILSSIPYQLFR